MLTARGCRLSLSVAGGGPKRALLSEAKRSGTPVHDHGYLGEKALRECLDRSDVGVVPMSASSWVAVPNKVIDYASSGLAVINGLKGETQDLLDRYAAGLPYTVGSASSFVSAVQQYDVDRNLLARHRRGARRLAEERFDAAKIYPRMADWLAQLPRRCSS